MECVPTANVLVVNVAVVSLPVVPLIVTVPSVVGTLLKLSEKVRELPIKGALIVAVKATNPP